MRHLETAVRLGLAVAVLAHWRGREFRDQGLGHAAHLGVVRRHRAQRATVAADEETPVMLFELGETSQLV